jgi:hypothetical protein
LLAAAGEQRNACVRQNRPLGALFAGAKAAGYEKRKDPEVKLAPQPTLTGAAPSR